jgi:hypothetical protein
MTGYPQMISLMIGAVNENRLCWDPGASLRLCLAAFFHLYIDEGISRTKYCFFISVLPPKIFLRPFQGFKQKYGTITVNTNLQNYQYLSMSLASAITQYWPPKPTFTEEHVPSQTGKVFIITGSNQGIGFERVLFSKY